MAKPPKLVRKVTKDVKVRKVDRSVVKDAERRESMKSQGLIHRRRKNPSIRPGMQLGELYVLQRVATKQGSSGGQKWACECSCGTRLTIPQWYLMRKEFPKRHCGCVQTKKKNPYQRERGIWYMMHRRCYNETHVAFKHYGGANPRIGVCDSWNKDVVGAEAAFANFIADMGKAPSKGHTLDRVNPYQWYGWIDDVSHPGRKILNCRWATHSEQMNNLKRHWKKPEQLEEIAEAEVFDVIDDDEEDEDDGE